jgi:hypothetical protein
MFSELKTSYQYLANKFKHTNILHTSTCTEQQNHAIESFYACMRFRNDMTTFRTIARRHKARIPQKPLC